MVHFTSQQIAFAFGLLGNIISFMVFLAPLPTFYQIHKRKSTQGFQSIPYVVALFSCMLWLYYASLKPNMTLLITINSVGFFIETIYICFFLFHAPKKAKVQTIKMLVLLIVVGFGLIVLLTHFLVKGVAGRARIVGWICLVFSLCVFVAPLGILKKVIQTKSVEYMPFLLSFTLTVSAVMWFFYGLLLKDFNIAIPNVLGFFLGIIQMVLYVIYKNKKEVVTKQDELPTEVIILNGEQKLPEQILDIVKLGALISSEKKVPVGSKPRDDNGDEAIAV